MENLLKKQLAQIKARALWLRNRRQAATEEERRRMVDDLVETGAVTRGADFVPRPAPAAPRRWPWQREAEDNAPSPEAILARYKTGDVQAIDEVAGGEARAIDGRTFYVVRSVGRDVDPAAPVEATRFSALRAWPEQVESSAAAAPSFEAAKILFLDIETTGLSANTYVFLVGLMYVEGGHFVVEQVFARDYSEETGVLLYVRDKMAQFGTVVTYNGASFDLPFIRTRMAIHRVRDFPAITSVDLLYATRRAFRGILPNRRLVTVERHLRKVDREGDIPGRYIPEAYHDFVRTGDARAMKNVLYHNRMDLFTMAVIVTRLSDPSVDGER